MQWSDHISRRGLSFLIISITSSMMMTGCAVTRFPDPTTATTTTLTKRHQPTIRVQPQPSQLNGHPHIGTVLADWTNRPSATVRAEVINAIKVTATIGTTSWTLHRSATRNNHYGLWRGATDNHSVAQLVRSGQQYQVQLRACSEQYCTKIAFTN